MEKEEREDLVIDTDFLSSFFKIGKIDLIFEVFNVKKIFICQAVMKELEEAKFYKDFLNFIRLKENKIIIKSQLIKEIKGDFGEGKIESISLAKQTNSLLLMDDRAAGRLLSLNEIKKIVQDLKEKDYYKFTEEVEKELFG